MSFKSIALLATDAGIKLNKIKVTDRSNHFGAAVGGFNYDKEQLSQLEKFGELYLADRLENISEEGFAFDLGEIPENSVAQQFTQKTHPIDTCKKCGGAMAQSKAIGQTFTGTPDFAGDGHVCTMSPGGTGKLIDCMKCAECGWSVT